MARLNARAPSSDVEPVQTSESSEGRHREFSETPATDVEAVDSDKENRTRLTVKDRPQKRKSDTAPMSERGDTSGSASKRRRTEQQPQTQSSRAALQRQLESQAEKDFYDPDQNEGVKRATKKKLRELTSRFHDLRSEFLQAGSTGIEDTLNEANEIFKEVKQTSVATIDSRLLVAVGDAAYRKVNTLALGDTSSGIDVDDFVTKCISFMKRGSESEDGLPQAIQSTSTQRRRRRQADEDEDEDDEPMDWNYLGKNACFLYNARPCLSGFLLGPLSVQKKVRQQTQRRAKEAYADPSQAVRPLALGAEDMEKQESANLTIVCSEIARLLEKTIKRATQMIEQEFENIDEPDDEQVLQVMRKHGIADNACIPLFNFCVNPESFGQTVENMFYVSFLIKEGTVGLDFDSQGLPTLGIADTKTVAERQETQRNQAVFTLDYDIWQELVESFGIVRSIIPHRKDEKWDDGTIQAMS